MPLHGGDIGFTLVRLLGPGGDGALRRVADLPEDWHDLLQPLTRRPPPFAGLTAADPGRPLVMGIVNVTPDSFSGDGIAADPHGAIAHGHALLEAGADLLDIGGESTRPGAEPVDAATELARVLPVVRELAKAGPVSIDTRHAATMRAALEAGAEIVNDVSALRHDGDAARAIADAGAAVVLMHMPVLDPRAMQAAANYADVAVEVAAFLRDRVDTIERLGIPRARIAIDPGIGFGKTLAQNLELLHRLPLLAGIGCAILVGASRKGFIGRLGGELDPARRAPGSVAVALAAAARGGAILRVHDVAETVQALRVWAACEAGIAPPEAA